MRRDPRLGRLAVAVLPVLPAWGGARELAPAERARYVVGGGPLAVALSDRGEVLAIRWGSGPIRRALRGFTRLAGCRLAGPVSAKVLASGGVSFQREFVERANPSRVCVLVDRFLPAGESVRWEVEVRGAGGPWSVPIETHFDWGDADRALFWTAWGDSRPGNPPRATGWSDPLVPAAFKDMELSYGSRHFGLSQAISLPLATVLEPDRDRGVSLVLSPEDLILDLNLRVTRDGGITFSRLHHRIVRGRPLRFAMDLVGHAASWRAAVGWLVRRYPGFFDPPNPRVQEMGGCGAYSSHAEIEDPAKFMRMAFRVNWKASFDFPYMGMFLPPVARDDRTWIDFKGRPTSIRRMRRHVQRMRAMGFYVLNYFNVTEFGARIQYPPRDSSVNPSTRCA